MIKVLLTQYSGYPKADSGGPSKVIWQIIDRLQRDKFTPSFLSYELEREYPIVLHDIESTESHLSLKKRLGLFFGRNFSWYRKIFLSSFYMYCRFNHIISTFERKAKNYSDFSVIHSHDTFTLSYFAKTNSKKILTIHSKGSAAEELRDYYKNSKLLNKVIEKYKEIEIKSLNSADIITFPSVAAKNMFFESVGMNADNRVRIIYNGVDTKYITELKSNVTLFDKFGIPKGKKRYFLNVAHHVAPKRIATIITALSKLKLSGYDDFCFINVGSSGPETAAIHQIVKDFELEAHTFFLGAQSNNVVLSLMKLCDTFVMASERVVFDLVIIEAMVSGMVVIATNSGGNLEIIESGKTGYLFDSQDENGLLELLKIEPTNDMRYSAKERGEQFSIDNTVEQYSRLYEVGT